MKKKYSFSLVLLLGLVLGLASFFTSCTKERLQGPTENNVATSSLMQGQVATARQGSVTANATTLTANKPKIPSPDIGYNLVPNGLYYIQARSRQGLALDVPNGSSLTGVFIQQYNLNLSPAARNQWWHVYNLGNGYYGIENDRSLKCLDVPNGSGPGNKIHQSFYTGSPSQQWKIETSISTGLCRIYNRQTGLALDVPDGSTTSGVLIQQFTPNNGSNQTWYFRPWNPTEFF